MAIRESIRKEVGGWRKMSLRTGGVASAFSPTADSSISAPPPLFLKARIEPASAGEMMACVDFVEGVGVSEGFIGWLSPRISFSKDFVESDLESSGSTAKEGKMNEEEEKSGAEDNDFEFCLSVSDESLAMLPADELFYQGKLMPLQVPSRSPRDAKDRSSPDGLEAASGSEMSSGSGGNNPSSVSPKAPRCSSRWKEILGLKKLQAPKQEILSLASPKPGKTSLPSKNHVTPKSFKQLFRGGSESKSSPSDPAGQPLLLAQQQQQQQQPPRDSDADSTSGRLSVSSDLEELPRYSMDSERGVSIPIRAPLRVTVRKPRYPDAVDGRVGPRAGRSPYRNPGARLSPRGSSVDSPRMSSSGKIVFQSLERSCSSPSSFNSSARSKDHHHYRNARQKENWRGMERSYSANVRVAPVLNVPVCSLRASKGGASSKGAMFGFTQLFSPQKRDNGRPNRGPAQPPPSGHLQKREG